MKNVSLRALFTGKCPRCRKSAIFKPALGLTVLSMNDDCPSCGLHFEREAGYFVGAMYASYTIGIALVLPVALFLLLVVGLDLLWVMVIMLIQTVVTMPLAFRWARIFWLHLDYAFFAHSEDEERR